MNFQIKIKIKNFFGDDYFIKVGDYFFNTTEKYIGDLITIYVSKQKFFRDYFLIIAILWIKIINLKIHFDSSDQH